MLYLIFYDITSNSIRNKVAKILIQEGYERLQLSVFLGLENIGKQVSIQLEELLKAEPEAKFYMLPLPKSSIKNLKSIGQMNLDIDYLTGDKDSLII